MLIFRASCSVRDYKDELGSAREKGGMEWLFPYQIIRARPARSPDVGGQSFTCNSTTFNTPFAILSLSPVFRRQELQFHRRKNTMVD
jgi:hypothetical protein